MTEAVTQAAHAIIGSFFTSPFSNYQLPKSCKSDWSTFKVLHDLKNLKETGVLTDDEYSGEKEAVLCVLKKLKGC